MLSLVPLLGRTGAIYSTKYGRDATALPLRLMVFRIRSGYGLIWIEQAGITTPFTNPQFTIGNSSRNPIQGPGFQDIDLALIQRVKFRERYTAEVRAEVFNLTNTPPLGAPNTVIGSPGFGSITSAGDPRVVQLAAKMHF